jgi:hypothetical protein
MFRHCSRRAAVEAARPIAATLLVAALLAAAPASAQEELRVQIAPGRAYCLPDGEVRLTATVLGRDGEEVEADVSWSVIPPRMGRIDGAGLFSASGLVGRGIVRVTAQYEDERGTGHAVIEVSEEPPLRLAVAVEPRRVVAGSGEETAFSAKVTDPLTGDEVDAQVSWFVIPDGLGRIDESGAFSAGSGEGSGRVAARASYEGREGVGDAAVIVGAPPGPGLGVEVAPAQVAVHPGEEFRFEAVVTGDSGDPVDARVEWSVLPRRLGVIDGSGFFTAGPEESVGRVVATVATSEGPVRGYVAIEVRRPGPGGVQIRVRPTEAAVVPGGDAQFEAHVFGPDGEPLDVVVDWAATPPWIGFIDQDGFFTASEDFAEPPTGGAWLGAIVASIGTSEGTASDAARVHVRDTGSMLGLRIRPHRPIVAPGEDVQFESRIMGAEDSEELATEWGVIPGDLGTITPNGLFTANPVFADPSSGEFGPHEGIVSARVALPDGTTLTDRAHVRVRIPGQPIRMTVRPVFAVVPRLESVQFEVTVEGPAGQVLDLPVSWKVVPDFLGTISDDGVFTAGGVSIDPDAWNRPSGLVVAEVKVGGGLSFRGTAAVVVDLPDPQVTVNISPKSATLHIGESLQFEAEASLGDGAPIDLPFEWRVRDAALGTITDDGLFTAAAAIAPGHGRGTTVVVGTHYQGRLYWDVASVTISGG